MIPRPFGILFSCLSRIFKALVIKEKSISFAGNPAIELEVDNPKRFSKVIIVESPFYPNITFTITIAEAFFDKKIVDDILSTFKFIK